MMAVGGHVVIFMNKNTYAASVLLWSFKKIDRICHSSTANRNNCSPQNVLQLLFYKTVVGGAMTDNQALFSNVHHLKGNMDDYRLQTEVLAIRQSIEVVRWTRSPRS